MASATATRGEGGEPGCRRARNDDFDLVKELRRKLKDPVAFRYAFFNRAPHPAQDLILNDRSQFKTIAAGRRFGKALDINTPIYTANKGWTTMGDLTIEDTVFDEQGNQCKINWVSEIRYNRPCYRITFSDGTEIVADEEHEWVVEVTEENLTKTLTTKELTKNTKIKHNEEKNRCNYSVHRKHPLTGGCKNDPENNAIDKIYITQVTPCVSVPVRCIEVTSPSHLYLVTHSFIPTHNSVLMADDINWYAITKPESIQFGLAPTYDQTRIIFAECVNQMQKSVLNEFIEDIHKTPFPMIDYANGSRVEFRSTKNAENIRGHKAHRAILDEAAFISDDVISSIIEPMLMDYNGEWVKISTPFGLNNHFAKTYYMGVEDPISNGKSKVKGFRSFHFTSYDNPHISHEYLNKKKEEYGEDSIIFRTEYLGEFIQDQVNVFPYADIMGNIVSDLTLYPALTTDQVATLTYPHYGGQFRRYAIGLDLAKHQDYTCFAVIETTRFPNQVVYFDRFQGRPYREVIDMAIALQHSFNDAQLYVDSTGIGDSVFEELEPYGAVGYVFTQKSKKHLIENLQKCLSINPSSEGAIKYPNITDLINELKYFEYIKNQNTKNVKMEAKHGYHDDCVIALALAALDIVEFGALAQLPEDDEWEFC